jgi:hypothetical protein
MLTMPITRSAVAQAMALATAKTTSIEQAFIGILDSF